MYISLLILLLILTDLAIILDIFLFRQILGFLYFTIVPGLLILQILRLYDLEFSKKFVLSVGLSISSLMFVGLTLNCLHPLIKRPLSFYPILVSLNIFVIVLAILVYWRNKEDFNLSYLFNYKIDTKDKYISPMLFSFLFPFLSVFGTYLMNTEGNNIILLIMLFLIPIYVATLVYLRDKIPEATYPVAIWMIGVALALTYGLRTYNIKIGDISIEYYTFKLTLYNSYWSISNFYHIYNTCLSVTILPTIYHSILGLEKYIYKLIYPVVGALMPVLAYMIFSQYFKKHYAFISAIFLISQFSYITLIGSMCRQRIALLFYSLIVLVLFEKKNINLINKKILILLLTSALVLSHYSTTLLFMIILFLYYYCVKIVKIVGKKLTRSLNYHNIKSIVSPGYLLLTFAFAIFWYGQITGVTYSRIIKFFKDSVLNLLKISVEELKSEKIFLAKTYQLPEKITIFIHDISIAIISIGVLAIIKRRELIPDKNFKIMVVLSWLILVSVTIAKLYSGGYDPYRIFLQLLIFLSPAFVVGGLFILIKFKQRIRVAIILILLTAQFFAGTYMIYQFFGVPYWEDINNKGVRYDRYIVHDTDIKCVEWIYKHKETNANVWADYYGAFIYRQIDPLHAKEGLAFAGDIRGYIFLRYSNVINKMLYPKYTKDVELSKIMSILNKKRKIYDNGYSEIWY